MGFSDLGDPVFQESASTPSPFLVGVAYYDFNGNGFYDIGEGIEGIEVFLEGGAYYAVSASAGGYAVPIPSGSGEQVLTFSSPFFEDSTVVDLPGGKNVKVDFSPEYAPPELSGSLAPIIG